AASCADTCSSVDVCDPNTPLPPPSCGAPGTTCFCVQGVSGGAGQGRCVDVFDCPGLQVCASDADCTDPNFPSCYETACDGRPNMCPAPRCGPAQCSPSTTTTTTTSTSTSTSTTTSTTTTTLACGNGSIDAGEYCDPPGSSCTGAFTGICQGDCTCPTTTSTST